MTVNSSSFGRWHYCRWIGLPWHFGRFGKWDEKVDQSLAEARMNYVEGASMLVTRKFLKEIGLMCGIFPLF
jgi:hypothetical protein